MKRNEMVIEAVNWIESVADQLHGEFTSRDVQMAVYGKYSVMLTVAEINNAIQELDGIETTSYTYHIV